RRTAPARAAEAVRHPRRGSFHAGAAAGRGLRAGDGRRLGVGVAAARTGRPRAHRAAPTGTQAGAAGRGTAGWRRTAGLPATRGTGFSCRPHGQMSVDRVVHTNIHDGDTAMSLYRPLALVAAADLLGGCATIPQPLQGNYTAISSAAAQQGGAGCTKVRWGGEIIKTEPGPQQTCFYILARPLD